LERSTVKPRGFAGAGQLLDLYFAKIQVHPGMLKKTMRRDEQSPIANQRSRIAITGADILTFSLHLRFENAGASGDIEENKEKGEKSAIAEQQSRTANVESDILTLSLHLRFENAGASGDVEENNGRGGQSPIANHHSAIANP
jgi:hypothetical protein